MKLLTLIVDDVIGQPQLDPPEILVYGHYTTTPVPVISVDYEPGRGKFETSAGFTDRVNCHFNLPFNDLVKPGSVLTVNLEN
jgi:hypothetical protein